MLLIDEVQIESERMSDIGLGKASTPRSFGQVCHFPRQLRDQEGPAGQKWPSWFTSEGMSMESGCFPASFHVRHHRDELHPHVQSGWPIPVLHVTAAHGLGRIPAHDDCVPPSVATVIKYQGCGVWIFAAFWGTLFQQATSPLNLIIRVMEDLGTRWGAGSMLRPHMNSQQKAERNKLMRRQLLMG